MSDHHGFLARQCAFGRVAFGPNERRKGVIEHIEQEIEEIEACETAEERAAEWVDVVILAQDGLLRAVREALREQLKPHADQPVAVFEGTIIARLGEPTNDYVAKTALDLLMSKRDKNELRDWPDWRETGDVALNHKEGVHD